MGEVNRFGGMIGGCPALLEVFRRVDKVASKDINVLITGETGTGKELIARELHNRSERSGGPQVVVNCGAIPENLIESELFGHMKGSFTGAIATHEGRFQAANGGTLFLDEIGELPLSLQVKLLRALQERVITKVGGTKPESVDIRLVSATNRDLAQGVREGTFREDLYYRLNVINLHLPPLRDRGEDVVAIAEVVLKSFAAQMNVDVKGFTPKAIEAIRSYGWPGNVRELENKVKKALVLTDKTLLGVDDLGLEAEETSPVVSLAEAREEFSRRYVLDALHRNSGNRTKTARELGVDPGLFLDISSENRKKRPIRNEIRLAV